MHHNRIELSIIDEFRWVSPLHYLKNATGHIFCTATSLQRGQTWPRWREVAAEYRRLSLQFCVLLMMGVVDTRNM